MRGLLAGSRAAIPSRPLVFAGSALGATLSPWLAEAHAANAMERAVERLQPCQSLKVQTPLGTIGIDQFKAVSIPKVSIVVDGDRAVASASGSLSCRTSDHAVIKGDAMAAFDAAFALDLQSCTLGGQKVEVTSTGGTFGGLVQAMKGRISATLQDGLAGQLKKLCQ